MDEDAPASGWAVASSTRYSSNAVWPTAASPRVGNLDPEGAPAVRRRLDRACASTGRHVRLSVLTGILIGPDQDAVEERARAVHEASGSRAPGPTAIVGTHAMAVARLRADADSGVDRVMLGHGNHMDLETVRIFGSEVALQV